MMRDVYNRQGRNGHNMKVRYTLFVCGSTVNRKELCVTESVGSCVEFCLCCEFSTFVPFHDDGCANKSFA